MNTNRILLAVLGLSISIIIGLLYYAKIQQDMFEKTLQQIQYNQQQGKDAGNHDPYKGTAVNNSLRKIAPAIQNCYNQFIETKPEKSDGFVEIDWIILPDGKVKKAELVTTDLKGENLSPCILGIIKNIEFPPPPLGSETYMTYKYKFKKSV